MSQTSLSGEAVFPARKGLSARPANMGTMTAVTTMMTAAARFTGKEHDEENQFDFFQARYLSAAQQRFLSPDPMNAGADPLNPQSWNGYAYVNNNPLNATDPTGMSFVPCELPDSIGCVGNDPEPPGDPHFIYCFFFNCGGGGGFNTNALGGNPFSGATDLIQSFGSGAAVGHNVFYNMGQGLAAGPTQGFGAVFGKGIKGTPLASGPVDVATEALVTKGFSIATGAGQTIQALNGVARLGSLGLDVEGVATGVGTVKLIYDAASYGVGLVHCY
jgi:RHS repeat-associated protein